MTFETEQDVFWAGDFAGEIIERHTEMKLLDYGFVYLLVPNFLQDNMTSFLIEKTMSAHSVY